MSASLAIVLLTQRRHGESLLAAAAHFIGETPADIVAISLLGNESRAEIQSRLHAAVHEFADGTLILCDLFGSTHAVIADGMAQHNKNIICVCGLNLSMLMEAHAVRGRPLKQAAAQVAKAGRQAVVINGRI